MSSVRVYLEEGLAALGLHPPDGAVDRLLHYKERLIEKNQVMNLTAITAPLEVARLHFLDSAALLAQCDLDGKTLIDVGTGAGFPGLVLKILVPDLQLTLLDSLQKRLLWLEDLCRELSLEVSFVHGRAEEVSHDSAYRDRFDVATARAVANLPLLCELCLPYVKPGGAFLAMKTGREDEQELRQAQELLPQLGAGQPVAIDYALPGGEALARRLLRMEKETPTPPGYPRKWSKLKAGRG